VKIEIPKLVTALRDSEAKNVYVSFSTESDKRADGSERNNLLSATVDRAELLRALGGVNDDGEDQR